MNAPKRKPCMSVMPAAGICYCPALSHAQRQNPHLRSACTPPPLAALVQHHQCHREGALIWEVSGRAALLGGHVWSWVGKGGGGGRGASVRCQKLLPGCAACIAACTTSPARPNIARSSPPTTHRQLVRTHRLASAQTERPAPTAPWPDWSAAAHPAHGLRQKTAAPLRGQRRPRTTAGPSGAPYQTRASPGLAGRRRWWAPRPSAGRSSAAARCPWARRRGGGGPAGLQRAGPRRACLLRSLSRLRVGEWICACVNVTRQHRGACTAR